MDGNLVSTKKGYVEFCLNSCPNLKQLDLKKVTPEMREQNGVSAASAISTDDRKTTEAGSRTDSTAIDSESYLGKLGQSTLLTSNSVTNSHAPQPHTTTNVPNTGAANEDISPEGLLQVISQEWTNEMERVKAIGLNGYKRKKESRSECLVQSGHAEIEGDNKLFIYGNALEVLNNPDF
jgi:hypothetical protein